MSFSKNDLDNIKSKISIRSELEKKTKLIQKGKDFWCCCPFHSEKTPSCKLNEDQESFYCFGCGAKGDIFTLYTDLYNYNFIDAVKELSQQAGITINFNDSIKSKQESTTEEILNLASLWFHDNLKNSAADICNKYIKKRKLNNQTIEKFKLGYSYNSEISLYNYLKNKSFKDDELLQSNVVKLDKNKKIRDYFYKRLIFPITNISGKVVGFGGRSLDDSNPKYINSPESKIFRKRHLLYNLNLARNSARKKNNLLVCEGYMDVISLNQKGVESVVAPLGTALTEDQLNLSWNYCSKPTIMFDGDSAGIRASYKSAIMALPSISHNKFIQFVKLPLGYDPDSYINEVSFDHFISKLKKPYSLSKFIFDQSIQSVSLEKVDEKISYDKYIDDLVETIKDQKAKYFYKNEFKSLFYNRIRNIGRSSNTEKIIPKKINSSLIKKQNLSFFATAINHPNLRENILKELILTELLDVNELSFVNNMLRKDLINLEKNEFLRQISTGQHNKIAKDSISPQIYQLFPYCSPSFDPQLSFEEVIKSINNLNTRLLNLKKINKSLNTFVNESNQLNWSDLQNINLEISDED